MIILRTQANSLMALIKLIDILTKRTTYYTVGVNTTLPREQWGTSPTIEVKRYDEV